MYGLVLLVATWIDRLQRRICRIVAPTIAASPESLGHHRHVAPTIASVFSIDITLVDVHLN